MTYHCPRSNWTGPESERDKPKPDSIVVKTHRTRCGAMRGQPCTPAPTRERFYRDGRIVEEQK